MLDRGVLLITGGTGSFGNAVVRRFLDRGLAEVRVLSRDESKQEAMRHAHPSRRLRFQIGDVRDAASVREAMRGVTHVLHAAALKQVPSCEFYPMEAVRTNVLGTENVLQAAIDAGVERAILLSTDKAVYPVNAMGQTKALAEKVMVAKSRLAGAATVLAATRYGNVIASRGSVIPLFLRQLRAGIPLTVTDPAMTRFLMSLDESVDLVLHAFAHARSGDIFVQKAPASTVADLATALQRLAGRDDGMQIIGTRHGEKLHETLVSREERARAEENGRHWRIPADGRDLDYGRYVDEGEPAITGLEDYTSHNTDRLDVDAVTAVLGALPEIQRELAPA